MGERLSEPRLKLSGRSRTRKKSASRRGAVAAGAPASCARRLLRARAARRTQVAGSLGSESGLIGHACRSRRREGAGSLAHRASAPA